MNGTLLFNCTHGREDPERALLPFVAANVAATAGLKALVVCTMDAVWLGTEGGQDGVRSADLPPLSELLPGFVASGGEVWLCGACTKPRGIQEADCVAGVRIVGAATIVEAIASGATPVAFA